ncbi:Gfo/Idh/MocA family protein [Cerasicoccus maritimus]|uniref:Gfo/Idh/MocA family protein n=1 Tax=Cerasicoccus maritimus TaxID=490089 RepID=UPI002852BC22|nr:Gfo/Idh/MocA family oxidoreductase [Cerasicoccus maritimus]
MSSEESVRLGIIGLGIRGNTHAKNILEGKTKGVELVAVSDPKQEQLDAFGESIRKFTDPIEMMESGDVEAVIIATPHYSHTTLGIAALERNLHVFVEKPISVHKADCIKLISAYKNPNLVFAAGLNQRCIPYYRKLRELIQSRQLGKIERISWTITDWYRTDAYYQAGSWRATWKGEGGGVLLNQCSHNLDILQWLFGMPEKVTAICQFGRHHDIEVEDAVTALLEFSNGATGVFITSTGESPGMNRLEVAAENGLVVIEKGHLKFTQNDKPTPEHCRTAEDGFQKPESKEIDVITDEFTYGHVEILQNFADAILTGAPLIAPAVFGKRPVELANAMLYSAFKNEAVTLPLDAEAYEAELTSRY